MTQARNRQPFHNWPKTLVDPVAFRAEQERLSHVWTFLGVTHDLSRDGNWFRATIATRSVFVQRCGDELRGFENRCAHRSFPLRNADKGRGPIQCGLHGWRYDEDGALVAAPQCEQYFGGTPEELGARLNPIEIATCGTLIFGRFSRRGERQSLEQFLGESFDIVKAISGTRRSPQRLTGMVEANWRLCYHSNLEEYHGPIVHPLTLGRDGYPSLDRVSYHRFGWHSAYLGNPAGDGFAIWAAACRAGVWRSSSYRILHIFPDLVISYFRAHWANWFISIVQYAPVTEGRSKMRVWFYPAPFPSNPKWYDRLTRPVTNLFRRFAMRYFVAYVLREDNAVCEKLQSIAEQLDPTPILGAMEERIEWFEEAYAELMLMP